MSTKKIFEIYFGQNEKTEDLTDQDVEKEDILGKAAIKTVNKIMHALPDNSLIKNKETALNILAAIKKEAQREMQDPNRLAAMLDDIASEISAELTESKKIKVNIS
jgi:hypothetical protein